MCGKCRISESTAGDVAYQRLRDRFAGNSKVHFINLADTECQRFTGYFVEVKRSALSCCPTEGVVSALVKVLADIVDNGLKSNTDVFVDTTTLELVNKRWQIEFGILTKSLDFFSAYSKGKLV